MKKIDLLLKVDADISKLEETIISIKNQTIKDELNIFVVINFNDNSSTVTKILERHGLCAKITVLENEEANFARTYNIPDCSSDFILFIDANDIIEKHFCESLYEYAHSKNADIVFFDDGEPNQFFNSYKTYPKDTPIDSRDFVLLDPSLTNKMYKRSLFDNIEIHFHNLKFNELSVVPLFANCANNIYYLEEAKYIKHNYSGNKSDAYDEKDEQIIDVLEKLYCRLENTDLISQVEFLYIDILLWRYSKIFLKNKKYIQVNLCAIAVEDKFAGWRKNDKYKEKPFIYKLYVNLAYLKLYKLMHLVCKYMKNT